jgi:hypothetical protein
VTGVDTDLAYLKDRLQGRNMDALVRVEAELSRLREALEQIKSDIHPARPADEERPRWMHENSVWWNHYSPQEIAANALAGLDAPEEEA